MTESVPEVLKMLRERMRMDIVFVSEFTGGRRVIRHADRAPGCSVMPTGFTDDLETTWCQRVVDGRIPQLIANVPVFRKTGELPAVPFAVGSYLSTPLILPSGEIYGTLCCLSSDPSPYATERSLKTLRYTAQLAASKIQRSRQSKALPEVQRLHAGAVEAARGHSEH